MGASPAHPMPPPAGSHPAMATAPHLSTPFRPPLLPAPALAPPLPATTCLPRQDLLPALQLRSRPPGLLEAGPSRSTFDRCDQLDHTTHPDGNPHCPARRLFSFDQADGGYCHYECLSSWDRQAKSECLQTTCCTAQECPACGRETRCSMPLVTEPGLTQVCGMVLPLALLAETGAGLLPSMEKCYHATFLPLQDLAGVPNNPFLPSLQTHRRWLSRPLPPPCAATAVVSVSSLPLSFACCQSSAPCPIAAALLLEGPPSRQQGPCRNSGAELQAHICPGISARTVPLRKHGGIFKRGCPRRR